MLLLVVDVELIDLHLVRLLSGTRLQHCVHLHKAFSSKVNFIKHLLFWSHIVSFVWSKQGTGGAGPFFGCDIDEVQWFTVYRAQIYLSFLRHRLHLSLHWRLLHGALLGRLHLGLHLRLHLRLLCLSLLLCHFLLELLSHFNHLKVFRKLISALLSRDGRLWIFRTRERFLASSRIQNFLKAFGAVGESVVWNQPRHLIARCKENAIALSA